MSSEQKIRKKRVTKKELQEMARAFENSKEDIDKIIEKTDIDEVLKQRINPTFKKASGAKIVAQSSHQQKPSPVVNKRPCLKVIRNLTPEQLRAAQKEFTSSSVSSKKIRKRHPSSFIVTLVFRKIGVSSSVVKRGRGRPRKDTLQQSPASTFKGSKNGTQIY